ncbi:CoA-transferase family III domain-containing protein [Chytriomyces cf. hyalinus JEL632]|nr:CoA-transferase family III domain-containing protein [Chytriomyces cf. hyalinus JEL632]
MGRGKKSVSINLRSKKGIELAKRLIAKADVVLDAFRPGVMESLGLGPDVIQGINPRRIFARLTGFGQTGELSRMAGHDINYIAVSGALSPLGRSGENPMPPANILGDFAGGGMLCVMGILMALIERNESGKGQVIDSALVDGAAYLSTFLVKMNQGGMWNNPRGTNMLDTGAHFYETYRTKDGRFMAVWERMKRKFAEIFATKTRDEWCSIFTGTDACVTPVLEWDEVMNSKHYQDRWAVTTYEQWTPPPAPILSRTPVRAAVGDPAIGGDTRAILEGICRLDANAVDELVRQGVVGESVQSRDSKL